MKSLITRNDAYELLNEDILTFLDYVRQINQDRQKELTYSKNVFLPLTHIVTSKNLQRIPRTY